MEGVTANGLVPAANALLEELCLRFPLGYRPTLLWRPYRVTAGMAYYRARAIGLSIHVLQTEDAMRETLLHEYAHLLAVQRAGKKASGHGPVWCQAMRDLGLEPKVRHNYEVVRNVPRQKVTYQCVRCGAAILRSRRLPRRKKFVHASCGGDLRLTEVVRS